MRNINAELKKFSNIHTEIKPMVRCPECGVRMPSNQVLIQRHFMERHNVTNNAKKRETNWKFQTVAPIVNPLGSVLR